MSDNYFDAMPYKFEFTSEEVTKLVSAAIRAQVENEQFIKNYADNKELINHLEKEIDMYQSILDKLRHPA